MTLLDNKIYSAVINEMAPFFEENGFKSQGGVFSNETKAFKVEYDEEKKVFVLLSADVTEGELAFSAVTSYLFTEEHNEKDAVSVGIDFVDSARKAIGVKSAHKRAGETELPTATAGNAVTIATLTAKLLATYPELKETYKEETAIKGKFLYLDFYTSYFVPEIRKSLDSGAKKNVKKLMDMLCEMFVTGDKATSTLVVVVLAAAIGKDGERFKTATERMEECPHLITAVNNEIAVLVKDKKLQKAMKFEG